MNARISKATGSALLSPAAESVAVAQAAGAALLAPLNASVVIAKAAGFALLAPAAAQLSVTKVVGFALLRETLPPIPVGPLGGVTVPISLLAPGLAPVTVAIAPVTDTTRGGRTVYSTEADFSLVDTDQDQTFQRLVALPSGWSGSGSRTFTPTGLELASGSTAGGEAAVTQTAGNYHFDAAVDVELLGPSALRIGEVILASFSLEDGLGSTASITVRLDAAGVRITAEAAAPGQTAVGGVFRAPPGNFTLRFVRNSMRLWAFYGLRSDGMFTTLEPLLDFAQFTAEPAVLGLSVSNGSRPVNVRTRFSNLTLTSHMRIGSRLVDAKRVIHGRIVGLAPAVPLEEVGSADVTVFGLFGAATMTDGFTYTVPPSRTVGRSALGTLGLSQDPEVHS